MALKHANPGEVVYLQASARGDPNEKTSALMKSDRFEAVRLVMAGGTSIPSHKVDGFVTLFCLEGHVFLEAGGQIELRTGAWIYLDRGAPHALQATEDSVLLLHIMFDR